MDSEQVVCRKATITDVLTVFLINYLAHAITVLISPGSSHIAAGDAGLWSLLVPYKGIYAALRIIAKQVCFGRDALERARRAGALCCVYKIIADAGGTTYTYDNNLQSTSRDPSQAPASTASLSGLCSLTLSQALKSLPSPSPMSKHQSTASFIFPQVMA